MFRKIKLFGRYISRVIQVPLITCIYLVSMFIIFQLSSVGGYISLESLPGMIMDPLQEFPMLRVFLSLTIPEVKPIMNIISIGCFCVMTVSVYLIVNTMLKYQHSMIDKNSKCPLRFLFIRRYIKYVKLLVISIVIKTLINEALQSEEIISALGISQGYLMMCVQTGLYVLYIGVVTYALPMYVKKRERAYILKLHASYDKKLKRMNSKLACKVDEQPKSVPVGEINNVSNVTEYNSNLGGFVSNLKESTSSNAYNNTYYSNDYEEEDDYYTYGYSSNHQQNFYEEEDDYNLACSSGYNSNYDVVEPSYYDYVADYEYYHNKDDDLGFYGDTSYLTMDNEPGFYGDTSYLTMD